MRKQNEKIIFDKKKWKDYIDCFELANPKRFVKDFKNTPKKEEWAGTKYFDYFAYGIVYIIIILILVALFIASPFYWVSRWRRIRK